MSFDMASASSVQVVMVIEPLIQYSSSLFPEGNTRPPCLSVKIYHLCDFKSPRRYSQTDIIEFQNKSLVHHERSLVP